MRNKTAGHSDMKGLAKSSRAEYARFTKETECAQDVSETYSSCETRNLIIPNSTDKMISRNSNATVPPTVESRGSIDYYKRSSFQD